MDEPEDPMKEARRNFERVCALVKQWRIAAMLFAGWFAYFAVAGIGFINWSKPLNHGSLGQFGDFFGAINSLLTLCAVIGVIVTYRQQQEQIRRQEDANLKQSREQFLTARLNSTVAVLEAYRAQAEQEYGKMRIGTEGKLADYREQEAIRMVRKMRRRLGILQAEAGLGFDRDWDPGVEREAIRIYLGEMLKEFVARGSVDQNDAIANVEINIIEARGEFAAVADEYRDSQPIVATRLDGYAVGLKIILDQGLADNASCERALTHLSGLLEGNFRSVFGGNTFPWNVPTPQEQPKL